MPDPSDPTGRGARWVYHYTSTRALRAILRDGVIRAGPTRLYRDLAMAEVIRDTGPIVWLSSNPYMETTTVVKLRLDGFNPIGSLCRIALPYGYAGDLGLAEYADLAGIPYEDWYWSVKTGESVGSNYTTWRVVPHDIPRRDWSHAEWLGGVPSDPRWEPWPLPPDPNPGKD